MTLNIDAPATNVIHFVDGKAMLAYMQNRLNSRVAVFCLGGDPRCDTSQAMLTCSSGECLLPLADSKRTRLSFAVIRDPRIGLRNINMRLSSIEEERKMLGKFQKK
jgi:hypothetical protein